ncbi:hypothetical protein [Campylobacter insulaenigrae]|uniref:hypothetical protein n=1 Tax=Campylobacter insulaenigrae TaxID=260714 RepID=UPI00215376DE|nr:hypothetical protein [Campylobacter insulaenigrae]MCR6572999.1 hypothetical protein [Campylobacter insulaenigrae]MCR6577466.1 hypothetical protein [Campylobacter insulaenigrae]MCR6581572.1 hypothetical protein [Campylobacter insulaenigrae]MCR6586551.1 hypothetical protein [Campylobacter insulaenigrae]
MENMNDQSELKELSMKIISLYKAIEHAEYERSSLNSTIKEYKESLKTAIRELEQMKEPNLFNQENKEE